MAPIRRTRGLRLVAASLALACVLLFLAAMGCGKGGGVDVPPASQPEPTQPPTGAIHGTVTYSGRIVNGQPVFIEVFLEGSSKPITSTQIHSPGGAYAFELAPRSYTLRAWISAHGSPGTPLPSDPRAWYDSNGDQNPDVVQVTAKVTTDRIDITLRDPPAGGIRGTVRYAGTLKFQFKPPIRIWALRDYPFAEPVILGDAQVWYPGGEYTLSATGAPTCYVLAWIDANFSGVLDWPDPISSYDGGASLGAPVPVAIRNDVSVEGIDIPIHDQGPLDRTNWAELRGPAAAGGYVTALAVDPDVSGTVYAAVNMAPWNQDRDTNYGRLYRSTDGGVSWQALFWTPLDIRALAVHGDTLYAGCTGDEGAAGIIYMSADGGRSWGKVHATTRIPPGNYCVQALALNPYVPSTVYAAGWYLGPPTWDQRSSFILRSPDDGKTWETVFQTRASGDFLWNLNQICALAVDPGGEVVIAAGEVVVDGRSRAAIYRSADAGENWTRTCVTELAMQFTSLWMHPVTPTIVYAGSLAPGPGASLRSGPDQVGPLFVSTDGGQTWSTVPERSGRLLAFQTDSLLASQATGVELGPAGGAAGRWVRLGDLPITTTGNLHALAADPQAPSRLYAGFERGGVWVSADGGATWQERNRGIRSVVYPRAIAIDPHDRNRIAVAAGLEGGFVSGDDGATWSQVITRECRTLAFDASRPGVVYAGVAGYDLPSVLRSRDGGLTWSAAYTAAWVGKTGHPGQAAVDALAIDPSGAFLYAAGLEATTDFGFGALLRSTDGGLHWTLVLTAPLWNYGFASVAIDQRNSAVAYAGGSDTVVNVGEKAALWRTDDGGAHWSRVHCAACDVGARDRITSIVIDPRDSNHMLVANSGMDIALTTDGGQTWQEVLSGKDSGYLLAIDPSEPRYVYTAGIARMQESTDGGQTWRGKVKEGMSAGFQSVYGALAIDNRNAVQSLYVGSMGVAVRRRKME